MVSRLLKVLFLALVFCAAWQLGTATTIYAKAWLAQALLERAWQSTLDGKREVRPWPWADTWPVAELSLPRLEIRQIVLAGDSGRVLAFGPGYAEASAKPGHEGLTLISGHRDTSFEFMQQVQDGDTIKLTSLEGTFIYTVIERGVVDQRYFQPDLRTPGAHVILVTCYPFKALEPGGDERFLVVAERQLTQKATNATLTN